MFYKKNHCFFILKIIAISSLFKKSLTCIKKIRFAKYFLLTLDTCFIFVIIIFNKIILKIILILIKLY